tara:strand:- start:513 stop:827 length:315 start_codon:yes stop_codon:yes gene_type:complete
MASNHLIELIEEKSKSFTLRFEELYERTPELPFEYVACWFYGLEEDGYTEKMSPYNLGYALKSGYKNERKGYWGTDEPESKLTVEEKMDHFKSLGGVGVWKESQ